MKLELPYVHVVKKRLASGEVRTHYYYRPTGQRIEGEPGTVAFVASYEEAKRRKTSPSEYFQDFISSFFGSAKFQSLSPRTRADYLGFRPIIEAKWSKLRKGALRDERIKRDFREWRDALANERGARQADLIFALTRRIVSFAKEDGQIAVNHLTEIANLYVADRSDVIWLPEHVEAFRASNPKPGMMLALILALNLGRRMGDLIKMTWGGYTGDTILVTNRKSGRAVRFPAMVTAGLRVALDTYRATLPATPIASATILTTPTGLPWEEKHFTTQFGFAKNAAGLTDLHFHDLRGTAVTVLAEAGCTEPQIASITGHSLKQVHTILERYLARTRALNAAATAKLEQTWIAQIAMR